MGEIPNPRFIIVTRHPISQALAIRKWSNRRAVQLHDLMPVMSAHTARDDRIVRAARQTGALLDVQVDSIR